MFVRKYKVQKPRFSFGERGSVAVLFAVSVATLAALFVVAVNTAKVWHAKREAQLAVDAAALTAVAGIPSYNKLTAAQATDYQSNKVLQLLGMLNGSSTTGSNNSWLNFVADQSPGFAAADVSYLKYNKDGSVTELAPGVQNSSANGIVIRKTFPVPLVLGRFVGLSTANISVEAKAFLTAPNAASTIFPMALLSCTDAGAPNNNSTGSTCGVEIGFEATKQSPATTDNAAFWVPGTSGAVSDQKCVDRVNGTVGGAAVTVDASITLKNGQTPNCLQAMADQCAARSCSNTNPWIVSVPVLECRDFKNPNNAQLNATVPVRAIAQIGITAVIVNGSTKTIYFKRICDTVMTGSGRDAGSSGGSYGTYSLPALIQ